MSALQLKVSRLRRALEKSEEGGQNLVVSRPPGYLLSADPGAVDSAEFAALLSRAEESENPAVRAELLAEALALWRGPAFADFAENDFVRPAAHRLEEQRLAAWEGHAEARLELGEIGVLLGELSDMVDRHPLRERLRALHMRALYRTGRQSDSLASYAELRDRLADELGLDPGPELVALHQAILEQDPALGRQPVIPRSVTVPSTNLPFGLTGLVGREEAMREVRVFLTAHRLVTLTGPGGVGKTRLAVETARDMAGDFPDGVWLVELAGLVPVRIEESPSLRSAEVAQIAMTVTDVMGVRDVTGAGAAARSAPELLTDALSSKRVLLVVDNCEHVLEPVAALVERLLVSAPELRVLATSRESLGVTGEVVWPVPPLSLPDPSAGTCLPALEQASAVRLFVERVSAAVPHFRLSADTAEHVAELCRRLDGIPLALELAATRMRVLGVRELVDRLDDRFRLLAVGRRAAPGRQQTLRAVIDWSWDLLGDSERVVLRRLAIHPESCTLDAAEAVCGGDGVPAKDVLDLLARLVDRSLVVATQEAMGVRYRLLESVAVYCQERLREAGELDRIQNRYQRYYVGLAKRAEPFLREHEQRQWFDRLDRESVNFRWALDGLVRQGAAAALDLVNALAWFWFLRGRLSEARDSLQRALGAAGDVQATSKAVARSWLAAISLLAGGGAGQERQANAWGQAFRDIDDPRERARAQWFMGYAMYTSSVDLPMSEELVEQALAAFRPLGDRWGTAAALSTLTHQDMARGNLVALKEHGERSLEIFRDLGDRWGQLQSTFPLASLAEVKGDYERATRLCYEGLRMAEELKFWADVVDRLAGLGRIALLSCDFTRSRKLHEQAVTLAIDQNYESGRVHAEIGMALAARREGELDLAENMLTSLLDWHEKIAFLPGVALLLSELGFVAEQRGDAQSAWARHLSGLAAARAIHDPRAVALALEGLAGAEVLTGRHDSAAALLGAADAARRRAGAPLPEAERGDVDRIGIAARAVLGEKGFAGEFEKGAMGGDHYLEQVHAGGTDRRDGRRPISSVSFDPRLR